MEEIENLSVWRSPTPWVADTQRSSGLPQLLAVSDELKPYLHVKPIAFGKNYEYVIIFCVTKSWGEVK